MNKEIKKETIKVKLITNTYYMYILQDTNDPSLYKISISTEKLELKYKLEIKNNKKHIMNVLFQIKLIDSLNPLSVEKTIHDYLKEKKFYIEPNWFKIPNDDDVIEIARSMLKVGE